MFLKVKTLKNGILKKIVLRMLKPLFCIFFNQKITGSDLVFTEKAKFKTHSKDNVKLT